MSRHDTEELDFVERFLHCEGLTYRPEKQRPGDAPDFLLHGAGEIIGLEVTRVHRETEPDAIPRQQMEGIRDAVLRGAKKAWDLAGLPPVEVHCHFNHHRTPLPQELHDTVRQLIEAVSESIPQPGAWVKVESGDQSGARLPRAVHTVTIYNHASIEESFWAGPDSEWGVDLTIASITERIEAKNGKLQQYLKAAQHNWLLLVMDSRRFSGMMRVPPAVLEHRFHTGFSRTCLLDALNMQVWDLKGADRGGLSA
jgi:hypothetical protein